MKWLPRSMAAQLLALLLLTAGLAHVIAVLMVSQLRTPDEVHPLSARAIEGRVASAYAAARALPEQAPALVAAMGQDEARLYIDDDPLPAHRPATAQEQALAERLRERLELGEHAVWVQLQPPQTTDARGRRSDEPGASQTDLYDRSRLDIALALPDGRWLHSLQWPEMMHGHWNRILAFSIPVGLLPISLIAFLFGRRLMRPLRALTEAARRLSRGEQVPPLRPEGPSDVRELAEAFNDMQQQLLRFVNDRTRMIASIGHDLRTPLTSLRIRAELIDDDALRAAMISTLDDMATMADETLQFARDDAQREPSQDIDLGQLLMTVVAQHAAIGGRVQADVETGIHYRCRPVHLKRAMDNLIGNAVRHGRTTVRLQHDAASTTLRIEIDDDGPGIAPDLIEQAFEPFVTLDAARNHEGGGGGLGLAIARSSIRAHGGEVTLHNLPGGGLRALVILPA